MKLFYKLALFALAFSSSLSAVEVRDELFLEAGYRNDEYRSKVYNSVAMNGLVESLKVKNLDLGTIGLRGRFKVPQLDCSCNLFENFYVAGFANWGWSGNSRYSARAYSPISTVGLTHRGTLKDGRTHDYQIALGYLIDLGCFLQPNCYIDFNDVALGISGGYTWNKQSFKAGHSHISVQGFTVLRDDPFYQGMKFSQKWASPFIGAELFYETCGVLFNAGYEYHFNAHVHASETFSDAALATFQVRDNTRRFYHGHSNIFFVNASYLLCDCWDIGLGFKYQDWNAGRGRTTYSSLDLPDRVGARSHWWATSFYGDIGYAF